MGIYRNEAVKSLPEQVQENKDNIKQINEILENIDPEQVATILSDIQALKAEQVVQNTAIGSNTQNIGNNTTAIENEKTARESVVGVDAFGHTYLKTATANKQILIENDGFITIKSNDDNALMLHPNGLVQLITSDAVVECNANEGVKIKANDSSENPYELVLKNNGDLEVSNGHVLKFDTTGALTIDGQPVGGGGGGRYLHNVRFKASDFIVYCTIATSSNTPFSDINDLKQALINAGFNVYGNFKQCTGVGYVGSTNYIATSLYMSGTNLRLFSIALGNSLNESYVDITTTIEFTDTVY